MTHEVGPAWDRLEDQIDYYSGSSANNKNWFIWLKIVQLICAAGCRWRRAFTLLYG